MGKSTYAIGGRSKRTCTYDGGKGGQILLLWCVRTNCMTPEGQPLQARNCSRHGGTMSPQIKSCMLLSLAKLLAWSFP